jgi:prepilin-type N-terminal cleavage/methylation domain-containing protein
MIRSRGFSLLEVMLALIVVAIGISVLMTFSASNQRETSSKSTGNDFSLVVNEVLEQFIATVKKCNDNSPGGNCDLTEITVADNITAYDYLCKNKSHSDSSCYENTITDAQYTGLKNAGIDLKLTKITTVATQSDIEQ